MDTIYIQLFLSANKENETDIASAMSVNLFMISLAKALSAAIRTPDEPFAQIMYADRELIPFRLEFRLTFGADVCAGY